MRIIDLGSATELRARVREKLGDYKGSLEVMERYLKLMQDQGQRPVWSEERLAELRTKAAKQ